MVVRVQAKADTRGPVRSRPLVEVSHHQSTEPPTVRVGPDRYPEGRRLEARIPTAKHPVCNRPAFVVRDCIHIVSLMVRDATRFVGRERVGSEESEKP